jgi:MFS family permease
VAYAATTLFDNAFMSLLPMYGMAQGFSEREVSALLTVLFVGGIVSQYPIGWISDRTSSRAVMLGCGVVSVAGFVLFPLVLRQHMMLWGFTAVWGGAVLGLQTVALAELATRFQGGLLNTGNAVLAIAWGVSTLTGIPLAGAFMDLLGPRGLLIVVGGSFLAAVLIILRDRWHSNVPAEDG